MSETTSTRNGAATTQPTDGAPIRVLHVINGEHYAGAERVQDLLAQRLPDYGFEVAFACLRPGVFDKTRVAQQAKLFTLPMRGRLDLRPAFQLARILRDAEFQLLHTHTARGAVIGALASRLANVPMVHHVHSPAARDTGSVWRDRLNAFIERRTLGRAAALIGVSKAMGRYAISQGNDRGRVSVVPNGVPTGGRFDMREPPAGTWTIGTVALFRPRKGLEVLLQALALLCERGLSVRLRAVGAFETEDYEREIHALAAELDLENVIDWTGFTSDVGGELRTMDLFVLPSLFGEGLPMVILEAMAAGVPIVATRVEGVPEAIRDGLDGLVTKPGDAEDLARQIERIVDGRASWTALRQSARQRQEGNFSDHSMAEGVARVYRQVLYRENPILKFPCVSEVDDEKL